MKKWLAILYIFSALSSFGQKAFFLKPNAKEAADPDSLFIAAVKKYFFKETGLELSGNLYTNRKANENPSYVLYVSEPDTVQCNALHSTWKYPFEYHDTEEQADWMKNQWRMKGYQAFVYKTYATSSTLLTNRFLSYSNEEKCFIIFHELMHNYIDQSKMKVPYDINEALSDVVGNYGSLNYTRFNLKTDLSTVYSQIDLTEKIYECLNNCIFKINKHTQNVSELHSNCSIELQALLKDANSFYQDRFNYPVNNGYLLKNSSYCRNYFLLKRVLLKQGSIMKVIEIIKTIPKKREDYIKYLEKFT